LATPLPPISGKLQEFQLREMEEIEKKKMEKLEEDKKLKRELVNFEPQDSNGLI
jgi:hypothetical protein